jgi:microcystin degradation protein MlrC
VPRRRVFAGGICTETNVFSPIPTGLRDFSVVEASDAQPTRDRVWGTSFARYAAGAARRGFTYVQGVFAYAAPAGLTTAAAYAHLKAKLLAELVDALPLDGVLLTLHGAMAAAGERDCDEDIVRSVRAAVGDEARIGVLLDPHCDISDGLVDAADAIVAFKEYPHTDADPRADELFDLVADAIDGRTNPVMATCDCRMLGIYSTIDQPMRNFVDRYLSPPLGAGVLSASLGHGFPWGDSVDMGAQALVIADGDQDVALAYAAEVAREFHALRHEVTLKATSLEDALALALGAAAGAGPVVLADIADNAGGGAPSDSTFVLAELLRRGVEGAAVALLWDPVSAWQAFAAGEGAQLALRLGGKLGRASGDPLDLEVTVRGLVPDLVQRWPQENGHADVPSGDCAWLECRGIDVIVGTTRQQVLALDVFTAFGIDPLDRRLLVVKSMNHFRAAYEEIASRIIPVQTPGALDLDPQRLPYRHVRRDKYPWLDDDLVGPSAAQQAAFDTTSQ